jgi:hypothetical protein
MLKQNYCRGLIPVQIDDLPSLFNVEKETLDECRVDKAGKVYDLVFPPLRSNLSRHKVLELLDLVEGVLYAQKQLDDSDADWCLCDFYIVSKLTIQQVLSEELNIPRRTINFLRFIRWFVREDRRALLLTEIEDLELFREFYDVDFDIQRHVLKTG